MKAMKWLANFALGTISFIVGTYFMISLSVTFLKLTGRLSEGQDMWSDLPTPAWTTLLIFQAACVAVLGVAFLVRRMLRSLGTER